MKQTAKGIGLAIVGAGRVGLFRGAEIAIAFYIRDGGRADDLAALKGTHIFLQTFGVVGLVFSIDLRKHGEEAGEFVACDTGVASNRHAFGQFDRGVEILQQPGRVGRHVPENVHVFPGQFRFGGHQTLQFRFKCRVA